MCKNVTEPNKQITSRARGCRRRELHSVEGHRNNARQWLPGAAPCDRTTGLLGFNWRSYWKEAVPVAARKPPAPIGRQRGAARQPRPPQPAHCFSQKHHHRVWIITTYVYATILNRIFAWRIGFRLHMNCWVNSMSGGGVRRAAAVGSARVLLTLHGGIAQNSDNCLDWSLNQTLILITLFNHRNITLRFLCR